MRFKELYLSEAPIAYDDETSSKIGKMHIPSKTKWGSTPPEDATIPEIADWVEEKIKMKILKPDVLGQGSSRTARSNDGKTIFKYNYGSQPWGNQTAVEVKLFEKYKNEFGNILAKILKSGKNWYIQESAKSVDRSSFGSFTDVNYTYWRAFLDLADSHRHGPEAIKIIDKYYHNNDEGKLIEFGFDDDEIDTIKYIIRSPELVKIVNFCAKTKVDIGDLAPINLGVINNKLVIIDYGFTTKMGK